MPIGRPRIPGTEAERAETRRAKVRANVQAFRRRQKEKRLAEHPQANEEPSCHRPDRAHAAGNPPIELPTVDLPIRACHGACEPAPFAPEDTDSWMWEISSDMGATIMGMTYIDAFTLALRKRYQLDDSSGGEIQADARRRFSVWCSTWDSCATFELGKPGTGVLMEALLAASLAIVGRGRNDHDMTLHGTYAQTRALKRLRYAVKKYQEGDRRVCPRMLSLTALTCAMSELIINRSWDNFNQHLVGVGALIFHGGVERLNNMPSREHFYGYRAIQSPFLFINRQRTFLSNPEWIDFPWKKDLKLAQHPLHSMLDIALKVLPEIIKQDMPKKWKLGQLKERLQRSWQIVEELEEWERRLHSQHHGALYTEVPSTWGELYERRLDFSVTSSAVGFTMYTAVRIHVADLIANISEEILTLEPAADVRPSTALLGALQWSRLACRCLEFFYSGKPKYTGRIVTLWPLETAWEFFTRLQAEGFVDVDREIAWCRSAAERHVALGIPPFQWR